MDMPYGKANQEIPSMMSRHIGRSGTFGLIIVSTSTQSVGGNRLLEDRVVA